MHTYAGGRCRRPKLIQFLNKSMPCIDQCYYFIQITMVFVISLCRRFHGKSEICHMTKRSKKMQSKIQREKKTATDRYRATEQKYDYQFGLCSAEYRRKKSVTWFIYILQHQRLKKRMVSLSFRFPPFLALCISFRFSRKKKNTSEFFRFVSKTVDNGINPKNSYSPKWNHSNAIARSHPYLLQKAAFLPRSHTVRGTQHTYTPCVGMCVELIGTAAATRCDTGITARCMAINYMG